MMKKACILFLLVVMLLSLCACGKDDAKPTDPSNPTSCSHSFADATCTTPKTCTKCGVTEGDPAGHTLTAVCTACDQINSEFVGLLEVDWICKEEVDGSLTVATYYFYSEDGEQSVQIGYNQYMKLEKLAQETGRTEEDIRAEYAENEMLYEFDGVEYVYDGWGMDNWSDRRFTEENGVLTIEFLSLDWNEADEEVWTVEKTAVLTRTGFAEWTVTGGDYCALGLKLIPDDIDDDNDDDIEDDIKDDDIKGDDTEDDNIEGDDIKDDDNDEQKVKGTIAVIARGEYHAFWQAVKAGAFDAAAEHGYKITFQGPASESPADTPSQIAMVQNALGLSDIQALALATTGTGFVDELIEAYDRGIPVVELDSGLYGGGADITPGKDPTIGSVAMSNKLMGALAADRLFDYLLESRVIMNGYKVGIIQHDETQTGVDRATEFAKRIKELAAAKGFRIETMIVQGYWGEYANSLVRLDQWGAQAIFMTNEIAANEVFDEIVRNTANYKDILFCGADAGTRQYDWIKDAGKNYSLLLGSVVPDSYSIGYEAVMMAIAELESRPVSDVGIAGVWANAENIDALRDKNIFYMG